MPDIDESKLKLEWYYDENYSYEQSSMRDVPSTRKVTGGASVIEIDAENKEALKKMYSDIRGMILAAEHDVFVVSGKSGQRKHSGGLRKKIYRLVNIIEVAANFCIEYTQLRSIEAFLRSHPDALRSIFLISVVIREMVESFMDKLDIVMLEIPEAPEVQGGACDLFQLMPGYGTMKSILCSRALRMNEKEFEVLNQIQDPSPVGTDKEGEGEKEGGGEAIEVCAAREIEAL